MKIFGKTFSYWNETIGGLLIGIIICIILLFMDLQFSNWQDFIKEFPVIGMCAFGFLLTLLGLILQGSSKTIEWMKSRTKLFNRFVIYNKRIVILSLILSIYSYFLGYFSFQWIRDLFVSYFDILILIEHVLLCVFAGLLTWLFVDTVKFINLFYVLIKEQK